MTTLVNEFIKPDTLLLEGRNQLGWINRFVLRDGLTRTALQLLKNLGIDRAAQLVDASQYGDQLCTDPRSRRGGSVASLSSVCDVLIASPSADAALACVDRRDGGWCRALHADSPSATICSNRARSSVVARWSSVMSRMACVFERGLTELRPVRQLLTVVVSSPSKAAKSRTDRLMASCSATASKPVHARPLTIAIPYDLPPELGKCAR
ncbi:hypothetical protein IU486_32830 [Streptomyces gardneri]|nr:hypothetical protein [Streptomyces gardneri]